MMKVDFLLPGIFVWTFIFSSYLKLQGIMFVGFMEVYMRGATATSKVNFTQGIVITLLCKYRLYYLMVHVV